MREAVALDKAMKLNKLWEDAQVDSSKSVLTLQK
jgi:hypothetical protein